MLDFPRWKIISIALACAFFFITAAPNFISEEARENMPGWLPSRAVSLGLDLQGGSQLLLELDFNTFVREQLADLADNVRVRLREEKVGYKGLAVRSDGVVFSLRDIAKDAENVRDFVGDIIPGIEVTEKMPGEFSLTYTESTLQEMKLKVLEQSVEIVNRRVNETGTKEPIIQRQGEDRILLQVPGLENPEHLKNLLGQTAKMTFHMADASVDYNDLKAGRVSAGMEVLASDHDTLQDGSPVLHAVEERVMLSGDLLTDAAATYERGRPVVSFHFNTQGAEKFGEITSKNIGKPFAIVLDGKVITAPVIQSAILGGSGIITGNFTVESANDLALLLRAGALPAPLKVVEERTVGPSLGADSITAGTQAAMLGILLVVAFMLLCYGLFGLFANLALVINLVMLLAVLSLFQATLTLPGIAGIVLTLGMAVDANVLIFERIREEIRLGKTPFAAVDNGFKVAFATIIDSNLTTLIAALLLFIFGTGSVKGFAVTLSIGILTSMFSAITLTRFMVVMWLKRRRPKLIPL